MRVYYQNKRVDALRRSHGIYPVLMGSQLDEIVELEIKGIGDAAPFAGDRVTINGDEFQVVTVNTFPDFYTITAQRRIPVTPELNIREFTRSIRNRA